MFKPYYLFFVDIKIEKIIEYSYSKEYHYVLAVVMAFCSSIRAEDFAEGNPLLLCIQSKFNINGWKFFNQISSCGGYLWSNK